MTRSSAALLVLAAALAGCAGGESSYTTDDLKNLVLQPADVASPWIQFDVGPQARADAPPGARADPDRFGRLGGWKARYRRSGTSTTRGPLVIESRVDVFEQEDGARKDFRALEQQVAAGLFGDSVGAPQLGEEAVAATLRQRQGSMTIRFYLIAWRRDNATASVLINGFDRRTSMADAVQLARRQARRLAAADSA